LGAVGLVPFLGESGQPGGPSHKDRQYASGSRIECPPVTGLADAEDAADYAHSAMRADSRGFEQVDDAVHPWAISRFIRLRLSQPPREPPPSFPAPNAAPPPRPL